MFSIYSCKYSAGTIGNITVITFDTSKYVVERRIKNFIEENKSFKLNISENNKTMTQVKAIQNSYTQMFFVYISEYKKVLWFGFWGMEKDWEFNLTSSSLSLIGIADYGERFKKNEDLSENERINAIRIAETEFVCKLKLTSNATCISK